MALPVSLFFFFLFYIFVFVVVVFKLFLFCFVFVLCCCCVLFAFCSFFVCLFVCVLLLFCVCGCCCFCVCVFCFLFLFFCFLFCFLCVFFVLFFNESNFYSGLRILLTPCSLQDDKHKRWNAGVIQLWWKSGSTLLLDRPTRLIYIDGILSFLSCGPCCERFSSPTTKSRSWKAVGYCLFPVVCFFLFF